MAAKSRVTIRKVNAVIVDRGYELQRGTGYYYFSPLRDDVLTIQEQGLYGSSRLNAWTLAQIVQTLDDRIKENE